MTEEWALGRRWSASPKVSHTESGLFAMRLTDLIRTFYKFQKDREEMPN